ncbi:sensor histidine kinase [Paenibacillus thailandensis]|uniref:Sensor histidine kinase n=1 Tax=Paenibacillus thailandensis TaxID=393250 RepID=A0ABW5QVE3_9BACL
MKTFLQKIRQQRLFIQIFIVMVVSIIAVSLLTSLVTVRMSERLFMNTFSITNSKIISQIKTNFESFNYSIITASSNLQQSGSVKTYLSAGDADSLTDMKIYYNMGQQMKQVESNLEAYEVSLKVIGVNGRSYSSAQAYWPLSVEEANESVITTRTLASPKRLLYQFDGSFGADSPGESVIVASKALMERTSGDIYGVMYVAIREMDFRRFYSNFTSEGNDVAIVDQSGVIVSSNREELIGKEAPDLLAYAKEIEEQGLGSLNADVMGTEHLILSQSLPTYDFYLVNLIDKRMALSQMLDLSTIVLISLAIVAVALVVVFLITRRLTKSLTNLVGQMASITANHFGNYIAVEGSYETQRLGQAFNYMLDELNDYIDKLIETQKRQRNAELAALQMQINPHFLYNTLASIKVLVQQGSKEKATDTINALIALLQNTVSNISETITIEQELENLKNYVHINHVRYGERIKVSYFVAPDCLQHKLPKLVLQPFIENAFFHAFNEKAGGYIYVLVSKERDALICEVVDNGDGMDVDEVMDVTHDGDGTDVPDAKGDDGMANRASTRHLFSGIGIRNVHERIALLYGDEYGVTLTSKRGEGTRIRVRLPLVR